MSDMIRVSAANLAHIVMDDKYLLALNPSSLRKGNKIYKPFGGATEFYDSARETLEAMGAANFEKGNDLRFQMPANNLGQFERWFNSQYNRETSPYRELTEELVEEEQAISSLPEKAVYVIDSIVAKLPLQTSERAGLPTQYFFEVFKIEFAAPIYDEIRVALGMPDTRLRLVDAREIRNLSTYDGIKIGDNAPPLLKL